MESTCAKAFKRGYEIVERNQGYLLIPLLHGLSTIMTVRWREQALACHYHANVSVKVVIRYIKIFKLADHESVSRKIMVSL